MTNLFTRLADRSRNPGSMLRPVTPPLFGARSGIGSGVGSGAATVEPEAEPPESRRSLFESAVYPGAATDPALWSGVASPEEPATSRSTALSKTHATSLTTSLARSRTATTPAINTTANTREQSSTASAEATYPTPAPDESVAQSPGLLEPIPAYAAAQAAMHQKASSARPQTECAASVPKQAETSLRPSPEPSRARLAMETNATAQVARDKSSRSQAPTIEVTIGRIEIRTQAPPPPRPSHPRGPARQPSLSLEAYAAEREAGRR